MPWAAGALAYMRNSAKSKLTRKTCTIGALRACVHAVEWYSWIHFTPNKIEKKHTLEKYEWQKPHQENLTGTDAAYYPNKNQDGIKKKYSSWKE